VVAGKFFLYGSSVWMLREAGVPLWGSAGMVALLLSAGEATQRYLPGRVAESTDPLLALLAGWLVAGTERAGAPRMEEKDLAGTSEPTG
jgi:hypothetical protein